MEFSAQQIAAFLNGTVEGNPEVTVKSFSKIEEGKPGGNFVALPTATPLNVPLSKRTEENFHIFVDTVLEYGKY